MEGPTGICLAEKYSKGLSLRPRVKVRSISGELGVWGETLVALWKAEAWGWVRPDGTVLNVMLKEVCSLSCGRRESLDRGVT